MSFLDRFEAKLREIQRADTRVKKRWLYLLSALAMLLVVGLWMGYLNFSLPKVSKSEEARAAEAERRKMSFFSVFGRGLSVLGSRVGESISSTVSGAKTAVETAKTQVGKPNEFSLEGGNTDAVRVKEKALPPASSTTPASETASSSSPDTSY